MAVLVLLLVQDEAGDHQVDLVGDRNALRGIKVLRMAIDVG